MLPLLHGAMTLIEGWRLITRYHKTSHNKVWTLSHRQYVNLEACQFARQSYLPFHLLLAGVKRHLTKSWLENETLSPLYGRSFDKWELVILIINNFIRNATHSKEHSVLMIEYINMCFNAYKVIECKWEFYFTFSDK